jgi:hypothetical protein
MSLQTDRLSRRENEAAAAMAAADGDRAVLRRTCDSGRI